MLDFLLNGIKLRDELVVAQRTRRLVVHGMVRKFVVAASDDILQGALTLAVSRDV